MRVGIDAQPIAEVRLALLRFGDRYRRTLFTEQEVASCGGWGAEPAVAAPGLAARFAAKEALIKVLRVSTRVPRWTDIEVVRKPDGWPILTLSGTAAEVAGERGLQSYELSLSHTDDIALAIVVGF